MQRIILFPVRLHCRSALILIEYMKLPDNTTQTFSFQNKLLGSSTLESIKIGESKISMSAEVIAISKIAITNCDHDYRSLLIV